jgi:hypothetical protein
LSQLDAFFVAYQERAGILMQLGVEVDVIGEPGRQALEDALAHAVRRWPQLGQILHRRIAGLAWSGECRVSAMLRTVQGDGDDDGIIHRWRNTPIDPFREPPFQMLAVLRSLSTTLAFRAHHAVCDGEALVRVCIAVVRALAQITGGNGAAVSQRAGCVSLGSVLFPFEQLRRGRLPEMWRYLRRLEALRRTEPGAPLAFATRKPGDISTCEKTLDLSAMPQAVTGTGRSLTQPWLFAAAWVRAIGTWNRSKGSAGGGRVSLEVPVSLRSTQSARECAGNFISPLILFGDATQPIAQIAEDLRRQFRAGLRRRFHMAVPLFTALARYLPWPVFRRVALTPATTGFATSHFTWLEEKSDVYDQVASASGGRLRLLDHHIYAPVCLHMGAALTVFSVSGRVKLCLTYRRTAFVQSEAESLLGLLVAELNAAHVPHVSMAR